MKSCLDIKKSSALNYLDRNGNILSLPSVKNQPNNPQQISLIMMNLNDY